MSRLGNVPAAVISDDGLRLEGFVHPNGNKADVITSYGSVQALLADWQGGKLPAGGGVFRVGGRVFEYDGYLLTEIAQKGLNNTPHINAAHAVIRNYLTNQGTHSNEQHRQALEIALPTLMASTAWEKILELWIPLGADITGALVKLKYPSGTASSFTQNGTLTYSTTGGLISDGTTGYLSGGANPSTCTNAYTFGNGVTNNNWGLACYVPQLPAPITTNTQPAGVFASLVNGANYVYTNLLAGANQFVFDNDILTPNTGGNLQFNNGTNLFPPNGVARMSWVQASGGITACGVGGFTLTSIPSSGSNTVVNASVQICGVNGATDLCTTPIAGYALFNSMTQTELETLQTFFDQVNHLAYRNVFDGVLAFGDSIVFGKGLTTPATQRWTALLAGMLGMSEVNYGISGATMSQCPFLGNNTTVNGNKCFQYNSTANGVGFAQGNNGYLSLALQASGAYLCIGLGINDLAYSGNLANYIAAYTQTLSQLQQAGFNMSNVLIASITYSPGYTGITNPYYTAALAQTWNAALQSLASQTGCIFVDMFSLWNASNYATYLQVDNLHPNAAGHQLMSQQAYNAIAVSRQSVVANYVPVN